jgi:integrase
VRGTKRKRGTDRWQLQVYAGRHPDGRRRFVTTTITAPHTRAGADIADRALAALVTEVQHQHPTGTVTLAELADQYLQLRRTQGRSPVTLQQYRSRINAYLLPTLNKPIDQITVADIDALYAKLTVEKSAMTALTAHQVLSAMLNQAVRWEYIGRNVARSASPPQKQRRSDTTPTVAAIAAALVKLETIKPVLAVMARLAVVTGARRGSLCALRWTDLDLDTGRFQIARSIRSVDGRLLEGPTKTGEIGRGVLDTGTIDMLSRWRRRCRETCMRVGVPLLADGFVVSPMPDGSEPTNPDTLTGWWNRHRQAAGLDNTVRLHDLRHAMASELLAAGVDPATVAARGGWTGVGELLATYAHAQREADQNAADILGAMLG